MCTVVLLRRPGHRWPVLLAANRDEQIGRPWRPPGRHWPDRPDVVAGFDEEAGGSWLGVNSHGVAAAVLNRRGSLGQAAGKRSRGELVLEALDHADAADAAAALAEIDPAAYRTFNLVVADSRDGFWLANRDGASRIACAPIATGISIVTSQDMNDRNSPRVATYLPLFEAAAPPDPDAGDWSSWESLMASRGSQSDAETEEAMCIVPANGFGTVSSTLLALPQPGTSIAPEPRPVWRFAAGRPDEVAYAPLALDFG